MQTQSRSFVAAPGRIAGINSQVERIFFQSSASINLIVLLLLYAVFLAITYGVFIYFRRSYITLWPNDVMGLIDIAHRVYVGQVPYKDFQLFYGPLVAFVPALGLALGLQGGAIFGVNALVAAGVVLPAAAVLSARRLTPPAAVLAFVFLWLLIVVPMAEGHPHDDITWATFYNRHGWAAFIALLLFYLAPERPWRFGKWIDAAALAVLVLFSLYTKISFGVVSLGFVAASLVVSKYHRDTAALAIALVVLVATAAEVALHFHAAYLRNIIEFTSRAQGGSLGAQQLESLLIGNTPVIASALAALGAARAAGRRVRLDILFVLGCIAATIALRGSIGDSRIGLLVALVAVPLCFGELARRAEAAGGATGWKGHLASVGCLLLAFLFTAPEAENRVLALRSYAARVARLDPRALDLGALPGAPSALAGFLVYRDDDADLFELTGDGSQSAAALQAYRISISHTRSFGERLTAEEYMRTIVEGAQLLQTVGHAGRTVLTFDMVNPFPYVLGMPPGEHGYPQLWLYGPYSTNEALLPRPEALLGGADLVMVPALPYAADQLANMQRLYGTYLWQHFDQAGISPHWQLWARRPATP
jgi:hypothetical protein